MNKKDRQYVARWAKKIRALEYKGGQCEVCGENNCFILEFHHRDPSRKEKGISKIIEGRWSIIKKEIDKCDLLCRNCHFELHEREQWVNGKDLRISKLKQQLLEHHGSLCCSLCGYDKSNCSLDFHHAGDKNFTVSNELSKGKCITRRILKELDQCVVFCKNCHKLHHADVFRFEKFKSEIEERKFNAKELPSPYVDKIVELKKKGYRQYEIADELGCARSTVNRIWHL